MAQRLVGSTGSGPIIAIIVGGSRRLTVAGAGSGLLAVSIGGIDFARAGGLPLRS